MFHVLSVLTRLKSMSGRRDGPSSFVRECPACEMFVEEEQRVAGEIRVHCPRCGRKITDFEVE